MARNTIQRTIETSRIYWAVIIIEDGNVVSIPQSSIVLNGRYTMDQANKWLKKNKSFSNMIATSVEITEQLYEISVEDFLKYATPVNK